MHIQIAAIEDGESTKIATTQLGTAPINLIDVMELYGMITMFSKLLFGNGAKVFRNESIAFIDKSIEYLDSLDKTRTNQVIQDLKDELVSQKASPTPQGMVVARERLWLCCLPYDLEKIRNYLGEHSQKNNECGQKIKEILATLSNVDFQTYYGISNKLQTVFHNAIRAIDAAIQSHQYLAKQSGLDICKMVEEMDLPAKEHASSIIMEETNKDLKESFRNAVSAIKTVLHPEKMLIEAPSICNLVFEGGGPRGIAYAGALLEIEKEILPTVERVGGSSAGAMTALFVGIGMIPTSIEKTMRDKKILDLMDPHDDTEKDFDKLVKKGPGLGHGDKKYANKGLCKGVVMREWLRDTIKNDLFSRINGLKNKYIQFSDENGGKITLLSGQDEQELDISKGITFKQHHQLVECDRKHGGKLGLKDIYITVTDITDVIDPKLVVLSYENSAFKDTYISDAAQASGALPIAFDPCEFLDSTGNKHKCIDGGVLNNFPMNIFENKGLYIPVEGRTNPCTLGFKIDNEYEMPTIGNERQQQAVYQLNNTNTGSDWGYKHVMWKIYGGDTKTKSGIYYSTSSSTDDLQKHVAKYSATTMQQIYDKGVGVFAFDLTEKQKNDLIAEGKKSGKEIVKLRKQEQLIYKDDVIQAQEPPHL